VKVGQVHRLALAGTVTLPALGLVSGSPILAVAATTLVLLALGALPEIHARRRSRARIYTVHGLTLAGLGLALALFPQARIDAGLSIVMLGMANRMWLRTGQRDDLIIVGSAGALLSAATIVTPGIAFAILILLFVPAALWTMLTASVLGLAERSAAPEASFRRLAQRPAPPTRGAVTGWGIGLMVLGYVAVSFLPRHRFGHLLSPGGLMTFDGPGRSMRLDTGGVQTSGTGRVAMRVRPGPGVDVADLEGLYARLYSLEEFEGGTFTDGQGAKAPLRFDPREGGRRVEVRLRRVAPRDEPHPVAALGRRGPGPVFLPRPKRSASGTWVANVSRSVLEIRYVASLEGPAAMRPPVEGEAKAGYEARFLELPPDLDPRVAALARRLAAGAEDRRAIVRRVLGHFASGFRYSLEPLPGSEGDPVARFLFEARAGHCELYAASVALLLRAAGVPARVAAGYYGGWINPRSRELELGREDAHAWVEALVRDRWIWVDATPEHLRARRRQKGFAWIRDLWDAAEALWYEHVIDFDEARRRELLGRLEASFAAPLDGMKGQGLGKPGAAAGLLGAGLLALALGGLVAGGWGRGRRLEGLGRRLRRRLDPTGEGDSLPLGRLAARIPEPLGAEAARVVADYEAARFGGVDLDRRALRRAVARLERDLKRGRRAPGSAGRSRAR
jgi:transglutaminase-like putative cysteine protease